VVAYLENYRVCFKITGLNQELSLEEATKAMDTYVKDFEEQFGGMNVTRNNTGKVDVISTTDLFTGAILVDTQLYRELLRTDLHDVDIQLTHRQEELVRAFASRHLVNYYQLYSVLFHRRIVAQHMSLPVKCHFVKGLFQPLLVETDGLPSPFRYGEHSYMYSVLRKNEEFLERREEGVRKLNLSCIAMCDIAQTFGAEVVKELDRRCFMLMLSLACLDVLDRDASIALSKRYGRTFNRIMGDRAAATLFSQMIKYARSAQTALKVV